MSQYLESLAIGDAMEVKGPIGHVHYLGKVSSAPTVCVCFSLFFQPVLCKELH